MRILRHNEFRMPLQYHQHLEPTGEIGLWRITETELELYPTLDLNAEEERQLSKLRGHRRVEWLAARRLVHEMSGRLSRAHFTKDAFGKPHLQDSDWQISISHSRTVCAAIAGPVAVGIDIQRFVPKIERIAHKFMRVPELESLEAPTRLQHLHVYWCAKEALYKAYGRRQLDFCQHIHVRPFTYQKEGGQIRGSIRKGIIREEYMLRYFIWEGSMVAYALLLPLR